MKRTWTEQELINGLKAGEEDAAEAMLTQFGNRLLRGVFLLLKDHQAAEDVVQETFISALNGIKRFRGEAGLYTWLYRIAVNHARRVLGRHSPLLLDDIPHTPMGQTAATSLSPESKMVLTEALAAMPYIYREAIVLHYYFHMTVEEVAHAVGSPAGTVKARLHRGRNQLNQLLGEVISFEKVSQ